MATKFSHFSSVKRSGFTIAAIVFFLIHLSSCAFPLNAEPNRSSTDPNLLTIQFNLQIPSSLQEGERIGIEILDEVSGLPYNARQYEMAKIGDLKYATPLSFPAGSVVKYRYIKISDAIKTEANADGQPVRYRLSYVDQPSSIMDILQAWEGETSQNATGTLSGTLIDNENQQPIPDILISVGGQLSFTDANGKFLIQHLSSGTHNVVFYAIDGKYRTFQQGATISPDLNTPAQVELSPMPLVNVTFHVTAPTDALGAPIYLAGNIIQLGNTFTDLGGGMSIKPNRMPKLMAQDDGTYKIDLQLYAQTDLRYKFTLGDGYWNAEQQSSGGFIIRQLLVPTNDFEISVTIDSWRSSDVEPIIFNVSIPSDNALFKDKYIQFKTAQWTEPIPLWPLGGGNYLYILYSPLDSALPISYRYCRNVKCNISHNTKTLDETQVRPSEVEQTINNTVTSWVNWQTPSQPADILSGNIPAKDSSYKTAIEFTPQMGPSWQINAPIGLSELSEGGVNHVIFSPQWFPHPSTPNLLPSIGVTPFSYELIKMQSTAQSLGLSTSIFPRVGHAQGVAAWWDSQSHDAQWWDEWFNSYKAFILNYAKLAEISGASSLIIGGKAILPTFPEGKYPDGSPSDVPDSINDRWQSLITSIRQIYSGHLIWATNAHLDADPLPSFIYLFDEIYVSIDGPLAQGQNPSSEEVSSSFNTIIDTLIYEVHSSTLKPVSLGLAYPSADGGAQGCYLVSENCYNDGLFLPDETSTLSVDLDEQSLIYNAVMPIIASREWITGLTIRGVDPTISLQDASSSIIGKPAWDIIHYWFTGLNLVD